MLRGQYLRRGGQVKDFFDLARQLELAMEWIGKYHGNESIRERLLSWMAFISLHQFRLDIMGTIKSEIAEGQREKALEDVRPICYEYLDEIMVDGVHLVAGNRSDYKRVSDLGHFLFDYNDGKVRKHWEDRPYRKLYQRGRVGLDIQYSDLQLGARFSKLLFRKLYAFHWVLPYPSVEVFMQTTKQGERMWYSIETREGGENGLQRVRPEQWIWAKKGWRAGEPSEIPEYVKWDKSQWHEWMTREVARVNREVRII
jgi:hypothetical protein